METYLAWDPGETTGWALFDLTGKPLEMGEVQYGDELLNVIRSKGKVGFYVCEDYRFRSKARGVQGGYRYTPDWDPGIAARAIGYIDMGAKMYGIPCHYQPSSVLTLTAQAFNLYVGRDKSHPTDYMAAVLHGLHYARKHLGLIPNQPDGDNDNGVNRDVETKVISFNGYGDLRRAIRKTKR